MTNDPWGPLLTQTWAVASDVTTDSDAFTALHAHCVHALMAVMWEKGQVAMYFSRIPKPPHSSNANLARSPPTSRGGIYRRRRRPTATRRGGQPVVRFASPPGRTRDRRGHDGQDSGRAQGDFGRDIDVASWMRLTCRVSCGTGSLIGQSWMLRAACLFLTPMRRG